MPPKSRPAHVLPPRPLFTTTYQRRHEFCQRCVRALGVDADAAVCSVNPGSVKCTRCQAGHADCRTASEAVSKAMSTSGKVTAELLPHAGDVPATPRKGKAAASAEAAPATTAEATI
ncbi:uncharacterized protein PV07_09676 [Cladophialophora immunda]|uniref:Uncharacterized protein n=1 Tax=Cladophialophora immunda TaxID=569365 RepID=A0A0D2CSM6_9EURO|nr:uncharacterized protein PV07_09676 [Cladophialophora immunda]KIW26594.1 hypothetical protein PV07_09676 [Cladophialophora immunda]